MITIEVSDIDQAIENISRNGGEIIRGKDHLEGLGIQVYFKDTEDNIIGLWQDTSSK